MATNAKPVGVLNAAPVVPVAPANVASVTPAASAKMVPDSMADFVEMWGKRGFALIHWQDFMLSMKRWEDVMSNVASYNGLAILRREEHIRYWQVWQVAHGDKLAPAITSVPVPTMIKSAAPTHAKLVTVASGNPVPTYAKVATKSAATTDAKSRPAATKSVVAVNAKLVPAVVNGATPADAEPTPTIAVVPVVVKDTALADAKMVPMVVPVLPPTGAGDYAKLALELHTKLSFGNGDALEPDVKAKYEKQLEHCEFILDRWGKVKPWYTWPVMDDELLRKEFDEALTSSRLSPPHIFKPSILKVTTGVATTVPPMVVPKLGFLGERPDDGLGAVHESDTLAAAAASYWEGKRIADFLNSFSTTVNTGPAPPGPVPAPPGSRPVPAPPGSRRPGLLPPAPTWLPG